MGNPPFVGARLMSKEQKVELMSVFGEDWKNAGNLDYVSCWYKKASELMKGTYIRTLCTDIGEKLGCGAHMGTLLRTQVGHYYLANSLKLHELEAVKENITQYMEDLETIFGDLPKCKIKANMEKLLYNGNSLRLTAVENFEEAYKENFIRLYNTKGEFIALYKWDGKKNCLQVERMFLNM